MAGMAAAHDPRAGAPAGAPEVVPVPGTVAPAPGPAVILESRTTRLGSLPVRRALPQRGRRMVGPWCFLDEAGPVGPARSGAGVGPHPHIGLQAVTWVLAGELVHRDGLGTEQAIRPGQLNVMTAGRGIVHAEEHAGPSEVHLVQLWLAQPDATRHGPPAFEHHGDLALARLELHGGVATVLVGALGAARSPARRDSDHVGAELQLHGRVVVPLERHYEHAVVLVQGMLELEGRRLGPGELAFLGPGRDELHLRADRPARALLLGGVPFAEPILMWWNYVARTREEITAAHAAWTGRDERFAVPSSILAPVDVAPPPWARPSRGAGEGPTRPGARRADTSEANTTTLSR